jgi:hypothetical protein
MRNAGQRRTLDEAGANQLTVTSSAQCILDGQAHACITTDERDSWRTLATDELRIDAHVRMLASELDGCELHLSIKPAEM